MDTKNYIKQIIKEELSRQDIKALIADELDDLYKDREFQKKVREITADVFEDFFGQMWQRKGQWKNSLKNG